MRPRTYMASCGAWVMGIGRRKLLLRTSGPLGTSGCSSPSHPASCSSWARSEFLLEEPLLYLPAYAAAIVTGGYYIAVRGVASLRERYLDMNVLMIIAVIGAVLIRSYEEAASIVFLFSLAELLESFSVVRTRRSISQLLDFVPRAARILRDGKETSIDVTDIRVGDVAIVRPGERIPVDGEVVRGFDSGGERSHRGERARVKGTG